MLNERNVNIMGAIVNDYEGQNVMEKKRRFNIFNCYLFNGTESGT